MSEFASGGSKASSEVDSGGSLASSEVSGGGGSLALSEAASSEGNEKP